MRLAEIQIENFKGIGARQKIALAPITLLFGPNSAGKSTIIQSLHYLHEILERQNINPDQTLAGGFTDLGGFKALVHKHDLHKPIKIFVKLDLGEDPINKHLPINSGYQVENYDFSKLEICYIGNFSNWAETSTDVTEVGLELELHWSQFNNSPYISKIGIEINSYPVAEIHSPPQFGRARLTSFNFDHPLLQNIEKKNRSNKLEEEIRELSGGSIINDKGDFQIPTGVEHFQIPVGTEFGSLPNLDKPLDVRLAEIHEKSTYSVTALQTQMLSRNRMDYEMETRRRLELSSLLDELILGPVRIIRDYLRMIIYIGPLREIPSRNYCPPLSPRENRWASGLAGWDLLHYDHEGQLLREVSRWLSSEDLLQTGHSLERTELKEMPHKLASEVFSALENMLGEKTGKKYKESDAQEITNIGSKIRHDLRNLSDLKELYESLKTYPQIRIRDVFQDVVVAPCDVGIGVSQLIPIVVACLHNPKGIIAIEQPELHLHPAIQVGIGDLFIHSINLGKRFGRAESLLLIETHSEHLVLRLLRRIGEEHEGKAPKNTARITPKDLAVIYIEQTPEGVCFHNLEVDEEGEFIDYWPNGFFEERAGELF